MPSASNAARRCLHTGAATALEVDHIMPRNQGGTGDLSNLQDLCIADAYPVTQGHSLVIPRRHVCDGLELHQPEWNAVVELLPRRDGDCEEPRGGVRGVIPSQSSYG